LKQTKTTREKRIENENKVHKTKTNEEKKSKHVIYGEMSLGKNHKQTNRQTMRRKNNTKKEKRYAVTKEGQKMQKNKAENKRAT